MRASAITLLVATGLWATACGSGSSPGNEGPPPPLQNGEYQKPPSSYQDPQATANPSDYDKPPSTYQAPGSTSGQSPATPEGPEMPCERLCQMAVDGNCAEELDGAEDIAAYPFDQCVEACQGKVAGADCKDELANVSTCILDNVGELTCDQLERLGEGNPNNIPQEARDACTETIGKVFDCLEGLDEPDAGTGGDCTLVGRCVCEDDCAHCRCENLGDDGSCTTCPGRN